MLEAQAPRQLRDTCRVMRCYVEPSAWSDSEVCLSPSETHHLSHVMRVRVNDSVELFDGFGRIARAYVVEMNSKHAICSVLETSRVEPSRPCLHLAQSVIREKNMDMILQKATELGVGGITPLLTDHGVVKVRAQQAMAKRERWAQIVLNAAKQCGQAWLPDLAAPQVLGSFLEKAHSYDLILCCNLDETSLPLHVVLDEQKNRSLTSLAVIVGPEGDLSPAEKKVITQAGALSVHLGSSVLRAETAALYTLSVLRYTLMNLA